MKSIRLLAAALCVAALVALVPFADAQRRPSCASCSGGQCAAIFPTFAVARHCPCGVTCPAGGVCGATCSCTPAPSDTAQLVVTGCGRVRITLNDSPTRLTGDVRTFDVPPLHPPAGEVNCYRVTVLFPDGETAEQEVDVLPGQTTIVQVDANRHSVSDCGHAPNTLAGQCPGGVCVGR